MTLKAIARVLPYRQAIFFEAGTVRPQATWCYRTQAALALVGSVCGRDRGVAQNTGPWELHYQLIFSYFASIPIKVHLPLR